MEKLEQAVYEVDVYNNKIDVLLSVHKVCGEDVVIVTVADGSCRRLAGPERYFRVKRAVNSM
ncbi:hypothetical protein CCL09_09680 [Pseudomonas congelans]|nr:hypothetical protein CCL24_20900 [Pseudomonas congelans]PBQ18409.1 hypothetical protein CCL09_09680 [Pseudomonas congelans]